jgi:hypothetical protein
MNDPHTQIRHHKAGRTAILKVPTTFDVRIVPEVPTTVTAAARTRLDAVTDWITARQGGTLPIPSVIDAAVAILTAPPDNNDVTVSVHPATHRRPPRRRLPPGHTQRAGRDRGVLMPRRRPVRTPPSRPGRNRGMPVSAGLDALLDARQTAPDEEQVEISRAKP